MDRAAIDGLGIDGYELMSRAGQALFDDLCGQYPETKRLLVMCGPGNNGGDGYVVARLAKDAGWDVTLCSTVDPERLKGDAARACRDWRVSGGEVTTWPLNGQNRPDVAVDALLGTGIDRPVEGAIRDAIVFLNGLDCPVYGVDIPSGLNSDSGGVMGAAVRCGRTMSFVGRKRGLYTASGPDHCGGLAFDDLGIPSRVAQTVTEPVGVLLESRVLANLVRPRRRDSHKGDYGHVFAVGGIAGMSGAIRLCGEAALRSGAGLVTLVTDAAHAAVINLARPELMVRAVTASGDCLPDGDKVIAVGPGLGQRAWSRSLLEACLEDGAPLVVDADALALLARHSGPGMDERPDCVLTPHPGEAARLLGCTVEDVQRDRVGAAQALAGRFGANVVLKGCGTVVASADGRYAICPHGNPGMATAGSGDVLTGVIAAMLGQGLSGFDAACAGVLAHALAGDSAARQTGEVSLLAGDITRHLQNVWKQSA